MIVSFYKKFLFAHIPKTAGTSLSSILSSYRNKKPESIYCKLRAKLHNNDLLNSVSALKPKYDEFNFYNHTHLTVAAAKDIIPESIFDELFKFAVVRHPIDWQYSMYRHILTKHRNSQYRHIFEPVFKHESFSEYIRWRIDTEFIVPQIYQIVDASGKIIVDKVYRFEYLNYAFEDICNKLDISTNLPRINKGKFRDENVDKKTASLIFDKFKIDFEAFGYSEYSAIPNWSIESYHFPELSSCLEKLKVRDSKFSLWSMFTDY